MGETAVRSLPRAGVEAELTALVAAVYASHEGLADRVLAFGRAAEAAGDRRHAALARLILADIGNRSGRRAEGVRAALAELSSSDDRIVVSHAHAVLAGGFWRLGDNEEAMRHAYEADRLLGEGDPLCLRVDHANIFAIQVNDQRLGRGSHEEYEVAQRLAERLGETVLIVANLNNWAWSCHLGGDLTTALALVRRMLDHSEEIAQPLNTSCADTVARVLLSAGQHEQATAILEDALVNAPSTDIDGVPACLVTFAEIRRAQGDLAGAVTLLERCREMTRRDGVADIDAVALRLLATCHASLGDFEVAYAEMVEFHDAWTVRRSEQTEALASVTHARFALDEARRDSEHFRELAERDALTGLWNRRRSDEQLAALVAVPDHARPPLAVVVLDLDHFKLINDTFSHAVGDTVLRRVGEVLRGMVEPIGQAARHGGEEFLLLLHLGGEEAGRLCERLRHEIAAQDWDAVAPGLRVTTSVGVTTLRPYEDALSVVARADSLLYAAKAAGRDRVVAG